MEKHIRCLKCLKMGCLPDGKIPKQCPNCGNKFNKYYREDKDETLLTAILQALTKTATGNNQGFIYCDMHGWSKGDDLPMPEGFYLEARPNSNKDFDYFL